MATLTSNAAQVAAGLARLVASISFASPGRDQSLGRDLAVVAARGIQARPVPAAGDPEGGTWAANGPQYAQFKRAYYETDQPGLRTGQMLSLTSLLGRVDVSADLVVIHYGTDRPPSAAASGAALLPADTAVTDRQKAEKFEAGGRKFWGLDAAIAAEMDAEAEEALRAMLGK